MDTAALPLVSRQPSSPSCGTPDGVRTLVDEFLAEQATTSAVERFSAGHDALHALPEPAQSRWYRDLLPASAPGPGQQYAFEVDLDSCSGCKACVTACHSLNGLDEGESWRSVGLLVGTGGEGLLQPVTTGCHHCAEPGCLDGCPVDAYVKDDNGIVRHLDDQCIGCSYCTLTCPYEVPQYDASRGIVRKCDLCHDRLSECEAPACVQACPTEAIRITVVDVEAAGKQPWGFDAPAPEATRPSTVFRSTRDLQVQVVPVDRHTVRPRHAHPPLVVMLVLTQLAIGAFTAIEVLRTSGVIGAESAAVAAVGSLVVTALALAASLAHLGRPQYAWRAVIGLRHSWLSREIVAFGAFAPLGALHAVHVGGWGPSLLYAVPVAATGVAAALTGLGAVAASVMVYAATRREGWGAPAVGVRFALTTAGLGALAATVVAAATRGVAPAAGAWAAAASCFLAALALAVDLLPLRHAGGDPAHTEVRTARLLRGPLADLVRLRVGAGVLAILLAAATTAVLAQAPATRGPAIGLAIGAALLAVLAEGIARWWFFTAEGSPRMPGAPA